jgi:hypothetical protein
VQLGQTLPVENPAPLGQTNQAFNTLMTIADPSADWNATDNRVDNSCAPGCAQVSPRLIPVALFDPRRFQLGRATNNWTQAGVGCPTNNPCITVTNIIGFFVHGPQARTARIHYLKYPGMRSATANPQDIHDDAAWMVTTHLVR